MAGCTSTRHNVLLIFSISLTQLSLVGAVSVSRGWVVGYLSSTWTLGIPTVWHKSPSRPYWFSELWKKGLAAVGNLCPGALSLQHLSFSKHIKNSFRVTPQSSAHQKWNCHGANWVSQRWVKDTGVDWYVARDRGIESPNLPVVLLLLLLCCSLLNSYKAVVTPNPTDCFHCGSVSRCQNQWWCSSWHFHFCAYFYGNFKITLLCQSEIILICSA